jgi:hypothetical protein
VIIALVAVIGVCAAAGAFYIGGKVGFSAGIDHACRQFELEAARAATALVEEYHKQESAKQAFVERH